MTEAEKIAAGLSEAHRRALMPNSAEDRLPLVELGLVTWKQRPGQRYPSLMPTSLGYEVRKVLEREASK